jgi:hypothetical protein
MKITDIIVLSVNSTGDAVVNICDADVKNLFCEIVCWYVKCDVAPRAMYVCVKIVPKSSKTLNFREKILCNIPDFISKIRYIHELYVKNLFILNIKVFDHFYFLKYKCNNFFYKPVSLFYCFFPHLI